MGDAIANGLETLVGDLLLGKRSEPVALVIGKDARSSVGELI